MTAEQLASLLPLVLIFVVFYFLVLRPARNRQREAMALQSRLAVGQEVMTTAGLYATVVGVENEFVVLELAPGVTTRWARGAVARITSGDAGEPRGAADRESPESGGATSL